MNWYVELVIFGIIYLQVFTFYAFKIKLYQAAKDSNSVLDVDDVIARFHISEETFGRYRTSSSGASAWFWFMVAENLRVRQQGADQVQLVGRLGSGQITFLAIRT